MSNHDQAGFDLSGLIADYAGVLRFFSRLAIPRLSSNDNPAMLPDFRRAARVLPLVGATLALPPALVIALLTLTALPPFLIAVLAVGLAMLITGAFHEDGLADVADGFGGGGTRERKLEIMHDSRIGAFGVAALIIALSLRIGALAALIEAGGAATATAALVVAGGLSRTLLAWLWHMLPPARADGKSVAAGQPKYPAVVTASLLMLPLLVLGAVFIGPVATLIGFVLAVIAVAGLGGLAKSQIDGQTGDVLGAAQQVGEIAFLIGVLI